MAAVRTNFVKDPEARAAYIDGVKGLKAEPVTNAQGQRVTTADLNIPGAGPAVGAQPLSTYDLFVLWHYVTMMTPTPPGAGRNAAHQGPVFLPWHRLMLMLLEANIARVLGRPTFGLPYWDWAQDGELSPAAQPAAVLWTVWVPETPSRHATCRYSWTRPPRRSRRSGRTVAPEGGGVRPAGGC
jgi:tyrosinase